MEDIQGQDICRVCRCEGTQDRPLFHPCICTGSIKWIHQECLVQWMRYSRKEYCELCGYRFSFTPIYSPDMPRRLPFRDVASGLLSSVATAVKYWVHYTLVAVAWLGIVPLTACRIYRCLFASSVIDAVLDFPLDLLSTENIASDIFHGCFVVTCTLFSFIGLVWLREQILHGNGHDWEQDDNHQAVHGHIPPPQLALPVNEQQPQEDAIEQQQPQLQQPPQNNEFNIFNEEEQEVDDDPVWNNDLPNIELDVGEVAVAGDDVNWNPIEWDRAAEELTWERLLGLDGSLVFLEHVFWVVSLNTIFILLFAFCPYHLGKFAVASLGLKGNVAASHFEGLVNTLCGYCLIGMVLVVLQMLASFMNFAKSRKILGMCYVVVKVSLLSVVEIGVLPLVCGWWLDICSLSMFDATLRDRENSFRAAPGTSMFIHWLIGMVYVYYFASFILLLREILRPGVLWFLRNLNDPDFSPIQEMIHLPIFSHVRRLLASAVIFGTFVLLMLWLPVRILRTCWQTFLPYTVALHSEAQVNELSLELLLLQVILPALLEQSHTRSWLKAIIRMWCRLISWVLGLKSYLLGDDQDRPAQIDNNNGGGDLGAAHHALLQRGGPTGFQAYTRPNYFPARIMVLVLCVCVTLVVASLVALTVPVWLGRQVMGMWPVGPPIGPPVGKEGPAPPIHELYTASCGTYICWLAARAVALLLSWLPQGRQAITEKLVKWFAVGLKSAVAFIILIGVIPQLFGLLLELVVVVPLRVPLDQTPVLWLWQDWALGVLYTKIACAVTLMGPEWALRRSIERVYRDGIRAMNLKLIMRELAAPVIAFLSLSLAVPYVVAHTFVPLFVTSPQTRNIIARRVYPLVLLISITLGVITIQLRQFAKLYEHIKNDKYLVGRRLVNYHHNKSSLQN